MCNQSRMPQQKRVFSRWVHGPSLKHFQDGEAQLTPRSKPRSAEICRPIIVIVGTKISQGRSFQKPFDSSWGVLPPGPMFKTSPRNKQNNGSWFSHIRKNGNPKQKYACDPWVPKVGELDPRRGKQPGGPPVIYLGSWGRTVCPYICPG